MVKSKRQLSLAALVVALGGCSAMARGPEQYRDDTAALLETQNPQVKQCYDDLLKQDSMVSGNVAIKFKVQEDTGKIIDTTIDPERTTAPEPLAQCVLNAVSNLELKPADAREGQASFVYEFRVNTLDGTPAADMAPTPPAT